jgi:hypothetical protein
MTRIVQRSNISMSINNSFLAKVRVGQGFSDQNRFKFHRVHSTDGRLPSNSCIGRAPHDVPNLPALRQWGASDTALAFLDSFRIAENPRRIG